MVTAVARSRKKTDEHLTSYRKPLLTVDAALFTYHERVLKVLLVERSAEPETNKWALPGGIVDPALDDDLVSTVKRKLIDKTGVEPAYLDQLETVGNRTRDPRGWAVTVCYTALVAYQNCESHLADVSDVKWVEIETAMVTPLAFDHEALLAKARERLRQRALYSIVPGFALPEEFTFGELQYLHEILIGKSIQKRSFRRRIEQAALLIDTGEKRREGGRPAAVYRLKDKSRTFNFVRNLEAD